MFAHGTNELRSSNGGGGGQPKVFSSCVCPFLSIEEDKEIDARRGGECGVKREKREGK